MAAADPLRFSLIFVGGWTLMTIAMMLPASFPLLVMFHSMVRGRVTAPWLVAAVILGYLAVWLAVGAVLQLFIWLLHTGADRVVWHPVAPHIFSAVVLCIAGLYQFSPLKYACLEKCRSPLLFLVSHWRGNAATLQALHLGAAHGLFCVGCCWSLMLLMFLVGAGSLGVMLILGALMAMEKNFRWGQRLSAPLGFLLLAAAGVTILAGISQN